GPAWPGRCRRRGPAPGHRRWQPGWPADGPSAPRRPGGWRRCGPGPAGATAGGWLPALAGPARRPGSRAPGGSPPGRCPRCPPATFSQYHEVVAVDHLVEVTVAEHGLDVRASPALDALDLLRRVTGQAAGELHRRALPGCIGLPGRVGGAGR